MNFHDFFHENNDYYMSHQCKSLAQDFLQKMEDWCNKTIDVLKNTTYQADPLSRIRMIEPLQDLRGEYMTLQEIQTTEHKIPVFIKPSKGHTLGSAGMFRNYDSGGVFVYHNRLYNHIERIRECLRELVEDLLKDRFSNNIIHSIIENAKNLKTILSLQHDQLLTTVGHELSHIIRNEKDIISGRSKEELDKIFHQSDDPEEEKRMRMEYIKSQTKKYQHQVYKEHKEKIQKLKWYSLLTYIRYNAELKERFSDLDFALYCNNSGEMDARFMDALFPFLTKEYPNFPTLMKTFIEQIGPYWDHMTKKNQNKMRKRLFKFWEFKNSK